MYYINNYHTYWITGASDGIGRAVVLLLAQHGKNLILSAKDVSKLETLKQECEQQSSFYASQQATIMLVDFNCSDIVATRKISTELAPSVDVAILCAGVSQRAVAVDMEHESDHYIYHVNFVSPATTVKCLAQAWTQADATAKKKIILLSSVAGHIPVPSRAMYGAAKRALEQYCETVSNELVHLRSSRTTREPLSSISIVTVIPGFVNTKISLKAIQGNFTPWNKEDSNQLRGISVALAAKKIAKTLKTDKAYARKYIGMNISLYIMRWLYTLFPSIANKILSKIDVAT